MREVGAKNSIGQGPEESEKKMKKLMFAAAVAACATVGLAEGEIVSANIVGYNTKTTDGEGKSPMIGLSFIPVSGATAKLGDFKPADGTMDPDNDVLQKINPTTYGADAMYCYCDKTTADNIAEEGGEPAGTYDDWIGWWDYELGIGEEGAWRNDEPVVPGEGFMGLFEAYSPISFQSSGEAPTETTTIITDGEGKSPIIVNYIPKQITLGQFAPVDGTMDPDNDVLQEINPTTYGADAMYCYCDKTTADNIAEEGGEPAGTYDDWIGWWDYELGIGEEGAWRNNVTVEPGQGFMGLFEAYSPITFQLPSSLVK